MSIQRGITLINLALITLGCYFSVSLFYQVVGIRIQRSGPVPQAVSGGASGNASVRQNLSYYKPILDRDLFKTSKIAQTATTAQTVNLENLEETKLTPVIQRKLDKLSAFPVCIVFLFEPLN